MPTLKGSCRRLLGLAVSGRSRVAVQHSPPKASARLILTVQERKVTMAIRRMTDFSTLGLQISASLLALRQKVANDLRLSAVRTSSLMAPPISASNRTSETCRASSRLCLRLTQRSNSSRMMRFVSMARSRAKLRPRSGKSLCRYSTSEIAQS